MKNLLTAMFIVFTASTLAAQQPPNPDQSKITVTGEALVREREEFDEEILVEGKSPNISRLYVVLTEPKADINKLSELVVRYAKIAIQTAAEHKFEGTTKCDEKPKYKGNVVFLVRNARQDRVGTMTGFSVEQLREIATAKPEAGRQIVARHHWGFDHIPDFGVKVPPDTPEDRKAVVQASAAAPPATQPGKASGNPTDQSRGRSAEELLAKAAEALKAVQTRVKEDRILGPLSTAKSHADGPKSIELATDTPESWADFPTKPVGTTRGSGRLRISVYANLPGELPCTPFIPPKGCYWGSTYLVVPGTPAKVLVETVTSDPEAQRRLINAVIGELAKVGITAQPGTHTSTDK